MIFILCFRWNFLSNQSHSYDNLCYFFVKYHSSGGWIRFDAISNLENLSIFGMIMCIQMALWLIDLGHKFRNRDRSWEISKFPLTNSDSNCCWVFSQEFHPWFLSLVDMPSGWLEIDENVTFSRNFILEFMHGIEWISTFVSISRYSGIRDFTIFNYALIDITSWWGRLKFEFLSVGNDI